MNANIKQIMTSEVFKYISLSFSNVISIFIIIFHFQSLHNFRIFSLSLFLCLSLSLTLFLYVQYSISVTLGINLLNLSLSFNLSCYLFSFFGYLSHCFLYSYMPILYLKRFLKIYQDLACHFPF